MIENKLAIASVSLGQHASHTLEWKIAAAARRHFSGIEIVYADLETYSKRLSISILDGAAGVKRLCAENGLTVLSLNPFKNFEGHHSPLAERLLTAKHWMSVAQHLGAVYVQVPSQFDANSTGDIEVIVDELRQLADLGAVPGQPQVSIAYEAVAWGTYNATWQASLRIVEAVDRPNFGLCLDAFHVISRLWGDNRAPDGRIPGGERVLRNSLREMVQHCPLDRIFYVQLSDAELFDPPLAPGHPLYNNERDDHRLIWSRNARPFPLERKLGAYFPVVDFAKALLLEKGFGGWVSFEVFDRRMREEKNHPDRSAERGMESWRGIVQLLGQ